MTPLELATLAFVRCTTCRSDQRTYRNGKTVLTEDWLPPRGWAGTLNAGRRDIVIVSLNPGAPLEDEKATYLSAGLPLGKSEPRTITAAHARLVTETCTQAYFSPRKSLDHVFHKKSVGYARALLALMDDGVDPGTPAVKERCWFTDVLKCSTREESGPAITPAAFAACRRHLDEELRLLEPKLIVALGGRAKSQLAKAHGSKLVGFRHPSNGCARLESRAHDSSFERAAAILGSTTAPSSASFRALREAIQKAVFA